MINTSWWSCWDTTNPVILFGICSFSFPIYRCVVVARIRSRLSQALFRSCVCEFWIWRTKTLKRLFICHDLFSLVMIKFCPIKGVSRDWPISPRICLFQASFSIFLSLLFMFVNPEVMVGPLWFDVRDLIMRIVAPRSWDCCGEEFTIFIKISFLTIWEFFPLGLTMRITSESVFANSWAFVHFSKSLYLLKICIFLEFEINFVFMTFLSVEFLIKLGWTLIFAYIV